MNTHYTFRKAAWVVNTLYAYLVPQNQNFNTHVYTRREAPWAVHTSYMYSAKASSLARSPLAPLYIYFVWTAQAAFRHVYTYICIVILF